MNEPAFKMLRKALPKHLHGRFIFQKGDNVSSVFIRGLGVLSSEKLLEQLLDWLHLMEKEITKEN